MGLQGHWIDVLHESCPKRTVLNWLSNPERISPNSVSHLMFSLYSSAQDLGSGNCVPEWEKSEWTPWGSTLCCLGYTFNGAY